VLNGRSGKTTLRKEKENKHHDLGFNPSLGEKSKNKEIFGSNYRSNGAVTFSFMPLHLRGQKAAEDRIVGKRGMMAANSRPVQLGENMASAETQK